MPNIYYALDADRAVILCRDVDEWSRAFANIDARRVGLTEVGPYTVSTVFLGINHRHLGDGPPLVFESMVFGPPDGDSLDMDRCSTWAEAEAMHATHVADCKAKLS